MLVAPRTWGSAAFVLSSFVLGVFWFTLLVTLISTGAGLLITLVGFPLLALTMFVWIAGAAAERWRVGLVLGTPVASPHAAMPDGVSWFGRIRRRVSEASTWRELAYLLLLLFPLGVIEFVVFVVVVTVPLYVITLPMYLWALPHAARPEIIGSYRLGEAEALGLLVIAIPLLLLMPYVVRGLARGHALLGKAILGPTGAERRIDELSDSRSRVLDAGMAERRRIERDLHDGVQQQLTALALDLGMARDKFDTDPDAAAALVVRAHEEAKTTLVDLRDLVRGIAPAILSDRGLDAAISALAARCSVPVTTRVELQGRLPDVIETTAYFIVAEALTNVTKHSGASEARVSVRESGGRLFVEVWDNGHGNADATQGSGLAGLADRAAAVDGRFTVDSPARGPTWIRAELPCAS